MKKKEIFWWCLMVFVFTIPLSQIVSVRVLIATLVLSWIIPTEAKLDRNTISNQLTDVALYLLVLIGGLIYSQDIQTGLKVLETNFSFLAIALICVRIPKLDEKYLNRIFYSFSLGLCIASLICLINAIHRYSESKNVQVFFFYQLTEIINFHPTYMAYYLIFSITIGLYFLFYQKASINPPLVIAVLSFFFIIMMLSGGQTAFISILFIFSFFILKFLIEDRTQTRKLTFGFIIGMMVSMFLIGLIVQDSENSFLNDSWERFVLWESAIKATPDLLLGVGTGDYKIILNDYYLSHGLIRYADDSFNSHNQFIQVLLTNGFLGVISILLLIFRPLYLAIKNQNVLGVLVFFPFLIYGMTEVFLGRYQGVVFFSLLHQVFVSYYSPLKSSLMPLKGV